LQSRLLQQAAFDEAILGLFGMGDDAALKAALGLVSR
jgi:hypothetical protein